MTCYNPQPACYSKSQFAKTGKKELHLVLHETPGVKDEKWILNEKNYPHALYEYIYIPCKKCEGCRSDNAKMWTIRAVNEMRLHDHNCFITLTYDDDSELVKQDPLCLCCLRYKHFQNFMKRLRKKLGQKMQYLVCGEYCPSSGRSHWHAILFGCDFPDKELVLNFNGNDYFSSVILQEAWSTYDKKYDMFIPIGFVSLAEATVETCAYVSQYVLKKLDIEQNNIFLDFADSLTGEIHHTEFIDRPAPIIRSSRNPSIGKNWFKKYGKNAVEKGFITLPNKNHDNPLKIKTPSYYENLYEKILPEEFAKIKKCKEEKMKKYYKDNPVDYDKLSLWRKSHLYRINEKIKKSLTKFKK